MRGRHASMVGALALVAASLLTTGGQVHAVDMVQQRDPVRPADAPVVKAPEPTGTSTLSGEVIADATGAKLRLAHVVLIGATTGVLKVTATDGTGRFTFSNLPADRYTVGASKLPYLGAVAGARRPVRPGSPIALADAATIDNVTIRLPMGAAISGVIYDERGQPAPGVAVSLQQRKMQNGERVLAGVGGVINTDDRGAYRAHGLAPGEYLVTAMPPRQSANARALSDADVDAALAGGSPPPNTTATDANMALAPVYYPGTTRVDDAQPVLLSTGEDRQNVDVRLERVRTGRIDGTVGTSDGQPVQNVTVLISTAAGSSPLQTTSSIRVGTDGRFGFASAPGSYTLLARSTGPQGGQYAFAQVEVAGVDVSGIHMTLQPPLSFAGRLTAAGTSAPPPLAGHRLQIVPLLRALGGVAAPQVTPTTATGEFRVTGLVPGRYVIGSLPFFGASAASVTWGLESVVVDGKDVTDLSVAISPDAMPKDVVVTLGDRWQELSGRLANAEGAGVNDYIVMLFPTNEAYWLTGSRRIVTAQPGTDGRFSLGGPGPSLLPAGDYYFAAVTDVSKDEQYDPAFLKSLISAAIRITLAPGEKRIQDLVLR